MSGVVGPQEEDPRKKTVETPWARGLGMRVRQTGPEPPRNRDKGPLEAPTMDRRRDAS